MGTISVLSTSCAMIVAYFPFDKQGCSIELASFELPSNAVNLIFASTPVHLGLHDENGDWEVLDTDYRSSRIYEGQVYFSDTELNFLLKAAAWPLPFDRYITDHSNCNINICYIFSTAEIWNQDWIYCYSCTCFSGSIDIICRHNPFCCKISFNSR
ncbi:CHRNB3 [Mytilus edulis]|uniref:CHRNB3 n=1 Tax=Mytilus edulis TaxID=6550 RepID=A0A8S3SPJ4_MYTED|nr:CHRNB3 [Mytilus edulis]